MSDPCPDCGRDRALVGIRHNCAVKPRSLARILADASPSAVDVAGLRSRIVELEAEISKHKADWSKVYAKLHEGTFHEPICSAHHDKPVGQPGCCCTVGRWLKEKDAENVTLRVHIVDLETKLVTLQKKGADRVKKHRDKKKSGAGISS